jgi:3-oxoacyl-[acyl-carrier protein] reductase
MYVMTTQKTAIVTGASRGIGAAIAERLARDGFAVVINYAGNTKAAEETKQKIEAAGGTAVLAKGDVADPAAVKAVFDIAEKEFGGVDVVVNNAGVLTYMPLKDTTDELFDKHFAVNVKGTFNALRESATRVRTGGRIINFSTSLTHLRFENTSVYTATKAAVEAMTSIFAKELRGKNITVNAVGPGATATELFFEGKTQEQVDRLAKMSPMERLGTPEDIAAAVSFLAGPDGGWINGQTLRANGGLA